MEQKNKEASEKTEKMKPQQEPENHPKPKKESTAKNPKKEDYDSDATMISDDEIKKLEITPKRDSPKVSSFFSFESFIEIQGANDRKWDSNDSRFLSITKRDTNDSRK